MFFFNFGTVTVSTAAVEPPNVDFWRFLLDVQRSYETGETRPYVDYAKQEMRVTEVHNILR